MTEQETLFTLSVLARDLANAKAAEDATKAARIAVEEKIAALVPGPEKGQKTITLDDGSKITVERGLNYKADCQKIEEALSVAGWTHVPVKTKTTRELDEKGYEWFRANDAEAFTAISQFVTVTPKKVSIQIKAAKL